MGSIFGITPNGAFTDLHDFGGADGAYPNEGLLLATDGRLYGTTSAGGTNSFCDGGCGTIFKTSLGGVFRTMCSFDWLTGAQPGNALVQGSDWSFYGSATEGGGPLGYGVGGLYRLPVGQSP